jgi:hypothetical protein
MDIKVGDAWSYGDRDALYVVSEVASPYIKCNILDRSKDEFSSQTVSYSRHTVEYALEGHLLPDSYNPVTFEKIVKMNKYNIEEGDIVTVLSDWTATKVTVTGVTFVNDDSPTSTETSWASINSGIGSQSWKLTKKGSKGKIIGYKLLKDMPNLKVGSVSKQSGTNSEFELTIPNPKGSKIWSFSTEEIKGAGSEWFEPIYEPIKPTEVKVKTNAGEVTVNAKHLSLKGETPVSIPNATRILGSIKAYGNTTEAGAVKIETFKVGCKTFSVSDIPSLEEAIKQVS